MAQNNLNCLFQRYVKISDFTGKLRKLVESFASQLPKITLPSFPKLPDIPLEEYWKLIKTKFKNAFEFQFPKIPNFCEGLPENIDPQKPKQNVVADTLAAPSTNNSTITAAGEPHTKAQLEEAKSQDLSQSLNVISQINKKLGEKGIVESREYVRLLQNQHPLLNEYTQNLSNFQPISESVGGSFFASTRDKPSLAVEDWKNGLAVSIRPNLKYKLPLTTQTTIQSAYSSLNQRFANHVSNEFLGEQRIPENVSHGYHLAGDKIWYKNHLKHNTPLMISLSTNLFSVLDEQAILVNYLYPIEENLTIANNTYEIDSEGQTFVIDQKGNIIPDMAGINNQTLEPEKPTES